MCYMFYIAADRPLPTIQDHDRYPDLTVSEARRDIALTIRSRLHATYIYFAASWQGCSCGFCYEDRNELAITLAQIPDEAACKHGREAWQAGYNSVLSLNHYLADHVAHGPIYRYIAWAGYEGKPITMHATITPMYFGGPSFTTPDEDTLFTVVTDKAAAAVPGKSPA